jgi:hypothetical protein
MSRYQVLVVLIKLIFDSLFPSEKIYLSDATLR